MKHFRQLTERKIVIASHNAGKVSEIADLLGFWHIECISVGELGLPEPDETGETFEENAVIKACAAATNSRMPALADDSGLAVSALDGAPGIHSARWAGPTRNFHAAMAQVEQALEAHHDRAARFICVLALVWPDGARAVFNGEVTGKLIWPPRGENGFGYDPMFLPDGENKTFGELDSGSKHIISHRARAFAKLAACCLPSTANKCDS